MFTVTDTRSSSKNHLSSDNHENTQPKSHTLSQPLLLSDGDMELLRAAGKRDMEIEKKHRLAEWHRKHAEQSFVGTKPGEEGPGSKLQIKGRCGYLVRSKMLLQLLNEAAHYNWKHCGPFLRAVGAMEGKSAEDVKDEFALMWQGLRLTVVHSLRDAADKNAAVTDMINHISSMMPFCVAQMMPSQESLDDCMAAQRKSEEEAKAKVSPDLSPFDFTLVDESACMSNLSLSSVGSRSPLTPPSRSVFSTCDHMVLPPKAAGTIKHSKKVLLKMTEAMKCGPAPPYVRCSNDPDMITTINECREEWRQIEFERLCFPSSPESI